jgi:microcystin-dependent protein
MAKIVGIHISGYSVGSSILLNYGESLPFGTLYENGQLVLVSQYPALFAKVGYVHGGSSDGTQFRVPDSRGKVKRGQNDGSGNDPNASTRTAYDVSGRAATGDNVGSIQGHATAVNGLHDTGHAHSTTYYWDLYEQGQDGAPSNSGYGPSNSYSSNAATANLAGDSETRMVNLYCKYAIVYV